MKKRKYAFVTTYYKGISKDKVRVRLVNLTSSYNKKLKWKLTLKTLNVKYSKKIMCVPYLMPKKYYLYLMYITHQTNLSNNN